MNVNREEPLGWLAKLYGSAGDFYRETKAVRLEPVRRETIPAVRQHEAEKWLGTLYRKGNPHIQVH